MNNEYELLEKYRDSLLKNTKRADGKKGITIIYDICVEVSKGSRDFKISNIGALSETRGGIKTNSLRANKPELIELIHLFEAQFPKQISVNRSDQYDWIERIDNQQTKFLVNDLLMSFKKSQKDNNILRSVERNIYFNSDQKEVISTGLKLADKDIYTIQEMQKQLDPKNLKRMGWTIGERGQIEDSNGNLIYPRGFTNLLQNLLTFSHEAQ